MNATPLNQQRNFIENAIALILLLILLYLAYNVIGIFLGVFTYAIILSVSFNGLYEKMVRWLGNKRKLAAVIYGVLASAVVVLPFLFILNHLGIYLGRLQDWVNSLDFKNIKDLPAWLTSIPFVGAKILAFWQKFQQDPQAVIGNNQDQIINILKHLISGGMGLLGAGLEIILGVIISAFVLVQKDKLLAPINFIMGKIVGMDDGPSMVLAAGQAIKGVAVGVMGTALIASFFAWVGFRIAGINVAAGLAAITFFLVLIQLGPTLVWVAVTIWLASQGETGWAIFIGIYGLVVLTSIDNILKPILIARSGKLPFLILFIGVIGGMTAWGFTGMFKGAITLAIFYTFMRSWIKKNDSVKNVAGTENATLEPSKG